MSESVGTSELEKLVAVSDRSQVIGEFLEGCGFTLCEWSDSEEEYLPVSGSIEEVLARFFGIDLRKVERERAALLESLQAGDHR